MAVRLTQRAWFARLAVGAAADDGEPVWVGCESVPARERLGDVAEQLAGYLGQGPALFADLGQEPFFQF